MKTINKLRQSWFWVSLALLCFWLSPTQAYAKAQPIITLSVGKGMSCHTSYEIAIYEDGIVKYDGYNKVIVKGHRETKITPETLRSLIKQFDDSKFMELQSRFLPERTPWRPQYFISMRQGKRIVSIGTDYRIDYLRHEIILAAGADKWVYEHIDTCYKK